MNILIVVHGHRDFSKGGAENAAFSMHHYYQSCDDVSSAILCASPSHLDHSPSMCEIKEYSSGEYLIGTSSDYFMHRNNHLLGTGESLEGFLSEIKPDVIHIHHYVHLGIDIIPLLKTIARVPIVMTIHEYIPLCNRNGQMLKNNGELCELSNPTACSSCFDSLKSPEIPLNYSENHFFLRDFQFRTCLGYVDLFISPSNFLVERYSRNGYNGSFCVVENGLPLTVTKIDRSPFLSNYSDNLATFGFFGQLNPFKGIIELLEAIKSIQSELVAKGFQLHIHGAGLEHQSQEFVEHFNGLIDELNNVVYFHGAYRQDQLSELMASVDWLIIPSIWWENSPVVIQESLFFYRPIVGSNLGGITEKISGKGGVLFDHQGLTSPSLAEAIMHCLGNRNLHSNLVKEIESLNICDSESICRKHIDLYREVIVGSGAATPTCIRPKGVIPETD